MSNYADINPTHVVPETKQFDGEFAALIKVVSSRYVVHSYPAGSGYPDGLAIRWEMESTKGNKFDRTWRVGIKTGVEATAIISPDGKHLIPTGENFKGISQQSDGFYFLQKALSSGFPEAKLSNDISVFEGECFFITTDVNPKAKGSGKKPYPKQYHPEGWEAARKAAIEKQVASGKSYAPSGQAATLQSVYVPPTVAVVDPDVLSAASTLVLEVLSASSTKTINKAVLTGKIADNDTAKKWEPSFRQKVTIALWTPPSLEAVVASNPLLKLDGDNISLKG